jgi:ribulose-phosphate 3-epimerase
VERIMPHLEPFELILVMSVNPGFGGQSFMSEVLDKVRLISPELTPNQRLEMDGGIHTGTVDACLDAGCDVVVAGSAVFGQPLAKRGAVIERLRGLAHPATVAPTKADRDR